MQRRVFLLGSIAGRAMPRAQGPSVMVLVADASQLSGVEGLRFRRAYAAIPEWKPAVSAILTGRFPHTAPSDRLDAILRRAGYRVATEDPFRERPFLVFRECGGEGPEPLLDALERSGQSRETLVIVTAASGPGTPGSAKEDSARVPLILRWPERLVNRETDLFASHVDLAPTVLSICGVTPPGGLHGRDLSRAILDGTGPRAESIFAYGKLGGAEEWRMVVRGLDKLVVNAKMQPTHLYNLALDPLEETNLVDEATQQRLCDELTAHLADWVRRIGYGMDPSGLKIRG